MTEWTAAQLDALPEGTVIECDTLEGWWVLTGDRDWRLVGDDIYLSSEDILDDNEGGPIRVVSVPVDALMGAAEALMGGDARIKRATVRAAIAHVTGAF